MTIGALSAACLDLPGIRHAFFTREGGVSGGLYASLNGGQGSSDQPEAVVENRARMAAHLGVAEERLLSVYQIHSPDVAIVKAAWKREDRPKADAMVTNLPGFALGVSSADCGPLLFADPKARVIGAAHSGWKGAIGGVLEATVSAMEALGARRRYIRAALGMTISRAAYEVGPEFVARFIEEKAADARYFSPGAETGKSMFDLPAFIVDRLSALGLAQVEDLSLCTFADENRFFSYRRTTHRKEPDYGRHISAIVLEA
jgi:polyphenol oxidase